MGNVTWGTAWVGRPDLHEGLGEMATTARSRVGLPILAWVLGFALLSVAWAFANPPGASQDERGQYIKTMGTALGQGNGAPLPAEWRPNSRQGVQLFYRLMRSYRLPTSLIPDARWGCMKYSRDAADCLDRRRPVKPISLHLTQMAKYPPAPYLVLGSVARWMPSARTALYAGRLAGALASVLLLAGAFAVARRGWARVGVAATAPMVVFWAGQLTTSGIETAAGVAQASAIVAIWIDPRRRGAWALYAGSGVCLALTRPFGPFLVVLYGLLGLLLVGRRAGTLVREHSVVVVFAVSVVAVSVCIAFLWNLILIPRTAVSVSETVGNLQSSLGRSVVAARQLMGTFGLVNNAMPAWPYVVAGTLYGALFAGALWFGTQKERAILVFATLLVVLVNVVLDAATQLPYGFTFQARFALPITVFLPVFAGAVIGQRRPVASMVDRRSRTEVVAMLSASLLLAVVLAAGWWATSRHAAVGLDGPWLFAMSDVWAPPMGWAIAIAFWVVGIALLVAAAGLNARFDAGDQAPTRALTETTSTTAPAAANTASLGSR